MLAESGPALAISFCAVAELQKIRVDTCPFFNLPAVGWSRWDRGFTAAEMKRCHWVKPVMVCQIKFTEWTRDAMRPRSTFPCPYFARPDALAACTSAPVKRSTFLSATNVPTASFNSC
jgi:hypothetical protein